MAHFAQDRAQPGFFGTLVHGVQDVIKRFSESLAWSRAFRETYDELSRLSDRELNDLGFSRGNLVQIAREAADQAGERA